MFLLPWLALLVSLSQMREQCVRDFAKQAPRVIHDPIQLQRLRNNTLDQFLSKHHQQQQSFSQESEAELAELKGVLRELVDDMDDVVDGVQQHCKEASFDINNISLRGGPRLFFTSILRSAKLKRYSKWLLAQSILLAINFFQNELNRRAAVYAAQRRLAEVPEFPLL